MKFVVVVVLALLACSAYAAESGLDADLDAMLHDTESHAMLQSMRVAAAVETTAASKGGVVAALTQATETEAARVQRTGRLVKLIKVLLKRLQLQQKRSSKEQSRHSKHCGKDLKADRRFIKRKLHRINRLRELLVIERATYVRLRDEGMELDASISKKKGRWIAAGNKEATSTSRKNARLLQLKDDLRELSDLIALLKLIRKRLSTGSMTQLVEVHAQLTDAAKKQSANKQEVKTMLELVAGAAGQGAKSDLKQIRSLLTLLIQQLQGELRNIKKLLKMYKGGKFDDAKALSLERRAFNKALINVQTQRDNVVHDRDGSTTKIMQLQDDIKLARNLIRAKRAHMRALQRVCSRSNSSQKRSAKSWKKQIKLLKKIIRVLSGAKNAKTALALMNRIGNIDLDLPVWQTSDWSECSAECGPGVRTREVTCMKGGARSKLCSRKHRPAAERACMAKPCKRDCVLSSFSKWSECSVSCGGGYQQKERSILIEGANGGAVCPAQAALMLRRPCNMQACNDGETAVVRRIVSESGDDEQSSRSVKSFGSKKGKNARKSRKTRKARKNRKVSKKSRKSRKTRKTRKVAKKTRRSASNVRMSISERRRPRRSSRWTKPLPKKLSKKLDKFLDTTRGADASDFCLSLKIDTVPRAFDRCLLAMYRNKSKKQAKRIARRVFRYIQKLRKSRPTAGRRGSKRGRRGLKRKVSRALKRGGRAVSRAGRRAHRHVSRPSAGGRVRHHAPRHHHHHHHRRHHHVHRHHHHHHHRRWHHHVRRHVHRAHHHVRRVFGRRRG
jgi:hypothetical protein